MDPVLGLFLGVMGVGLIALLFLCYLIYSTIKTHMLKMKLRKAFFQTDERYDVSFLFRLKVNFKVYAPTILSVLALVALVAANKGTFNREIASEPDVQASAPNVGSEYSSNERTDVQQLRMHADNGDAEAQNLIGVRYFSGNGIGQDYAQALRYFKMAADNGNLYALKNLGRIYMNGFGTVQASPREAIKWYSKAANRNDEDACYELGCIYDSEAEFHNAKKALYWYRKASDGGNQEARDRLEKLTAK